MAIVTPTHTKYSHMLSTQNSTLAVLLMTQYVNIAVKATWTAMIPKTLDTKSCLSLLPFILLKQSRSPPESEPESVSSTNLLLLDFDFDLDLDNPLFLASCFSITS